MKFFKRLWKKFLEWLFPHQLRIGVRMNGVSFDGVTHMRINLEQKVLLTFAVLTASGNPASIDGDPEWSSSDPSVVELIPVEGNMNQVYAASRGLGSAEVSVVVDADLDEGEARELQGFIDFTVVNPEATVIEITAGEPEQQ